MRKKTWVPSLPQNTDERAAPLAVPVEISVEAGLTPGSPAGSVISVPLAKVYAWNRGQGQVIALGSTTTGDVGALLQVSSPAAV